MVDIVALTATAALTVRFWCGVFGVHDPCVVSAMTIAVFAEVICRLAVTRREWCRPQTFCDDRRFDLIAGISLGMGPWPITQVMTPMAVAPSLRLAGSLLLIACAAWRVATTLSDRRDLRRRRSVVEVSAVPTLHVASLLVLHTEGVSGA